MLLCGDGEYSISTTRVLRSKCYGSALEAVWSADGNGDYAVKEVRSVITAHDIDDDAHQGVHGLQGDVRHRDAVPRGEDLRREDAGRARLQLPRVLLVAVGRRGEEDRRDGRGSASFH